MGKLAVAAAVGLASFSAMQAANASLVIDIRATTLNGVPVSDPNVVTAGAGDVIGIQIIGRATGTNALNDEAFQGVHGSLQSIGNILGDLGNSFVTDPFTGNGSQGGSAFDFDADGDLDIGSTPTTAAGTNFWIARSAASTTAGAPVAGADPASETFVLGGATFTLKAGATGESFIDFLVRKAPTGANNLAYGTWTEDNGGKNAVTGVITSDGLTVRVPEPTGLALAGLATLGLLARRRNNA